jgi:uroporphyrinogen decarboxylase
MNPRDIMRTQIAHRETTPIPAMIWFQPGLLKRLNEHYGGTEWLKRLPEYRFECAPVEWMRKERVGEGRFRDVFGTLWRDDGLADHVERPALPAPALRPESLPPFESIMDPTRIAQCRRDLESHADRFRVVTAFGMGLYERSWALRGFEQALADPLAEPAFYEELLDRLTDLFIRSTDVCLRLPSDAVGFGDDWGDQNGVTMGSALWRRFHKPRYARIFGRVKAAGRAVIHHSCGSVAEIMDDLIEIGVDVLNPIQPEARGMNPYALKRRYGRNITLCGGLGTQRLLPFGTPAEIREEALRLCREVGRGGGFILQPAKALREETPTQNAVAAFEAFVEQA